MDGRYAEGRSEPTPITKIGVLSANFRLVEEGELFWVFRTRSNPGIRGKGIEFAQSLLMEKGIDRLAATAAKPVIGLGRSPGRTDQTAMSAPDRRGGVGSAGDRLYGQSHHGPSGPTELSTMGSPLA